MKFVAVNEKEIGKFYKRTKILELVENFKASGIKVARVEDWNYVSAKVGVNSINVSIKHFKISGVHAFVRDGEIYLVRTDD